MQDLIQCFNLKSDYMGTEIIMKKDGITVARYNLIILLSKGDIVEIGGIEYQVDCCCLSVDENKLQILVD